MALLNSYNNPQLKNKIQEIEDALDEIYGGNFKSMIKPILDGQISADHLNPYYKGQYYELLLEFRKFVNESQKLNNAYVYKDAYYKPEKIIIHNDTYRDEGFGGEAQKNLIYKIDKILVQLAGGKITIPKFWNFDSIENNQALPKEWTPPAWIKIPKDNN